MRGSSRWIAAVVIVFVALEPGSATSASVELSRIGTELIDAPPVITPTGAALIEAGRINPDGRPFPSNLIGRRVVHMSTAGERTLLADAAELELQGSSPVEGLESLDHWGGTTVFQASAEASSGVFSVDASGVHRLAGPGDPLPGGTGSFMRASSPRIGPAGVAFEATTDAGIEGVYFQPPGGPLELVMDQNDAGARIREHLVSDTGVLVLAANDLYHIVPGQDPELLISGGFLDPLTGFSAGHIDHIHSVEGGLLYFDAVDRPITEIRSYRVSVTGGIPEALHLPAADDQGRLSPDADDILYGRLAAIIDSEFVPILTMGDLIGDRAVLSVLAGSRALSDGRAVFRVTFEQGAVQEAWMARIVPEPPAAVLLLATVLGVWLLRSCGRRAFPLDVVGR